MNAIEKSAQRWFYILTYSFMTITALIGVAGIRLLFILKPQLSFAQLAFVGAIVFGLTLLGAILTLLVMFFYDPRRRTA